LAIWEKALGPEHPNLALSLINLAALAAAKHDYATANRLFQRGLRIEDRQIQEVFAFTAEEQKLQFIETIKWSALGYLSLIHQYLNRDPAAVRNGFETVLRRKGVVFDAEARTREAVQGRLPKAARQEWGRLSELRSELAQMLLNTPRNLSAEQYRDKLALLQREIEQAEHHLAKESGLVAKELQQRTITLDKVAKQLPKDSALVEFAKIRDFDFVKGQFESTQRYVAFVLTTAGEVTLVDLGEADALEGLILRALEDIQVSMKRQDPRSNAKSLQSLKALSAAVWAPLEVALKDVKTAVLSPDGQLSLVPFAALPDQQDRPLLERFLLTYVSTARDLVGAGAMAYKPESDLLMVANPAYDLKAEKKTPSDSALSSLRSRDFHGAFKPLPGAEREAKEIPPLVTGDKKRKQVVVGADATEGAVKAARSPRILHLATHGFFLQDEDLEPDLDRREGFLRTSFSVEQKGPLRRFENPLLRSGLALAGANNAAQVTEGDDGLLTALEITGIDLHGTDLVVLSACETAVGEVKTGEGVFGLRRAFALAGAKNLLMSLWPVNDETTANQMKAFYQNLQKLPPAEALRQAQLETIKELKAQYNGIALPGLWAPFILQGTQAVGQ
jgi:CHAT domain-containing protein